MGFFEKLKGIFGLTDRGKDLVATLRGARAFIAADNVVYGVGPCGYVPRSARVDPARQTNDLANRTQNAGSFVRVNGRKLVIHTKGRLRERRDPPARRAA
jgi:hypothetical protein